MADTPEVLVAREKHRRHRLAAGGVVAGAPVTWSGDPDDAFQIGSVTKVFTSLLLATYVEDGSLRLDQPVGQLLPDLTGPVTLATLEQLATHTSGLPRIPRDLWSRALRRHPDPYADIDHHALLRALASTRATPSSRPRYSNLGVGLLGHALTAWAGADLDTLLRTRVTGPLGMTSTGCAPGGPVGRRRRGRPHPVAWRFDALAGAGALWSTLADLQRFAASQLDPPPGRLGAAIRLTHQVRVPGRRIDQCLGWLRLHGRGGALLWHNGGTAGYRSFVGVQPQDGVAVVVLADDDRSVDGLGLGLARGLAGD
ncbi:serine hydrolase domain-containing protein [Nocardioides coralli]|uniref:serine hydrolase domain-containing protein n=1 Tax=Nocardioides coralli TaxID=2872154 RepID=UPI001CA3C116|nr:serine hydrolase domain-containing protein [Nocardioides coralli]QZY27618.1 beta-lactamase family protein [Nocardioides coralli]